MALHHEQEHYTKWMHFENGNIMVRRLHRIEIQARETFAATLMGDALIKSQNDLRHILGRQPINTVRLRREIAEIIITKEEWPF